MKILNKSLIISAALCATSSYAVIDMDREMPFHTQRFQSLNDVSGYESTLNVFDKRIEKLKGIRDQIPKGSAHWVDLDKNVSDLQAQLSIARQDVDHLRKSTGQQEVAIQKNLDSEIAAMRSTFDTLYAE